MSTTALPAKLSFPKCSCESQGRPPQGPTATATGHGQHIQDSLILGPFTLPLGGKDDAEHLYSGSKDHLFKESQYQTDSLNVKGFNHIYTRL